MSPPHERFSGAVREPRAIAVVPARLASTRLERKMLLSETGRPLYAHTAGNVAASGAFARVVVATDAAEIVASAAHEGIEAILTRADHASGTDRVDEAWRSLAALGESAEVVVGVQGDEPDLDGEDLDRLVRAFADPLVELATLAVACADDAEADRPHVVKVVCDRRGDALYFSRARIPARGHARTSGERREHDPGGPRDTVLRRHVGVYAYRPEALERFCALPRGVLEDYENLEQLRWLEAGQRIRVVEAVHAPQGIDTREDYERFVARWRARDPREDKATKNGGSRPRTG